VLQAVNMFCSEVCVLQGVKIGFTQASAAEQHFAGAHVMTYDRRDCSGLLRCVLGVPEEP